MEIDLKWGLPLAMPLALIITVRICWWATGFAWEGEGSYLASTIAIVLGITFGVALVISLIIEEKKLPFRIGKPATETPND